MFFIYMYKHIVNVFPTLSCPQWWQNRQTCSNCQQSHWIISSSFPRGSLLLLLLRLCCCYRQDWFSQRDYNLISGVIVQKVTATKDSLTTHTQACIKKQNWIRAWERSSNCLGAGIWLEVIQVGLVTVTLLRWLFSWPLVGLKNTFPQSAAECILRWWMCFVPFLFLINIQMSLSRYFDPPTCPRFST